MREQAASANGCDCLAVLVWPVASLAKHRVVHNADWTFTTAGGVLVAASGRVSWAACATLSSSNWSRAFTHFSIRYQDLPCEFSVVGTFRPTRPVVAFSSRLPSNDSRNKKSKDSRINCENASVGLPHRPPVSERFSLPSAASPQMRRVPKTRTFVTPLSVCLNWVVKWCASRIDPL